MKALILVDIQNDFCPGGSLAVPDGDAVVPAANRLQKKFDVVVATQDWHPRGHGSFAGTHGKPAYEVVEIRGAPQTLWPDHCVQGTHGAELAAGLDTRRIARVFRKGTDPAIDSYSGFLDADHRNSTGLADYLRERGVDAVAVAGLATDYCVKYTALDAVTLGFRARVIEDACRGVNIGPGDSRAALEEMKAAGVKIVHSNDIRILRKAGTARRSGLKSESQTGRKTGKTPRAGGKKK